MEFTPQEIQGIAFGDPVKAKAQLDQLLKQKTQLMLAEWDRERHEAQAILETMVNFYRSKTVCDHKGSIEAVKVQVGKDNSGAVRYENAVRCGKCGAIWVKKEMKAIDLPTMNAQP